MKPANLAKIAFAIAILVAAGWLYRSGSNEDEIPSDPLSTSFFICTECQHVQELTDRELDTQHNLTIRQQAENAAKEATPEKKRAGRAANQIRVLMCPACKKIAAKVARKCPTDGAVFVNQSETGTQNVCPKCGWSPIVLPSRTSDD